MKNALWYLIVILALFSACKTEFETVRTSGDANKMYEKANALYEEEEYNKAITLYELIIPAYRGKSEAEELYFNYANAHYLNRSFILSSHYFKTFTDTYTTSDRREEALFLRAMSHFRLSPKFKLDQAETQKAIESFQQYANSYPDSDRIIACNEKIEELRKKLEMKAYDAGKMYFNTRNYSSSIQSLQNMLKDFPDSDLVEDARFLIAKSSINHAHQSVFTRQKERYEQTVEYCDAYLKRHSSGSHSEEIVKYKNESLNELNKIENG
ncbi:MAG: outer membrane protein assembly factor BamD [Saprospiraceae bacterium]|jgi:outer membrane protein assembly factor BamD